MINNMLNSIHDKIKAGDVGKAMEHLIIELKEVRSSLEESEWKSVVKTCLQHPLKEIIHADPFTCRSYEKPRGYTGDAILLDMIYSPKSFELENISDVGKQIFKYTTNAPACKAVKSRKDILADIIDETADKFDEPKIMSVACGHLREAEISSAIKNRAFSKFIAIDYDKSSLSHIEKTYSNGSNIVPLHLSVRDILNEEINFGNDFELIYSAGLYDYLDQKTAKKLTAILFDMLSPKGQLLIANFLPDIQDIGYMEAYMGWYLIFRDEFQLLDIASEISRKKVEKIEIFSEEMKNIVFLKLLKNTCQ